MLVANSLAVEESELSVKEFSHALKASLFFTPQHVPELFEVNRLCRLWTHSLELV